MRRAGTSTTASPKKPRPSSWARTRGRSSRRPRRSASRSSTRRNSCAAHGPNPKLASQMSAPSTPAAATEALTIGRAALRQLHDTLIRDTPDFTVPILQEVGFAAGAGGLNDVLSAFFRATGWGSVSVSQLGNAALVLDSSDWAEAAPGSAQEPMCFFSSGMLADFFGRLSGEPVAVMEVECRSRND